MPWTGLGFTCTLGPISQCGVTVLGSSQEGGGAELVPKEFGRTVPKCAPLWIGDPTGKPMEGLGAMERLGAMARLGGATEPVAVMWPPADA